MAGRYADHVWQLETSVFATSGDTDGVLRRAVEERAAVLGGRTAEGPGRGEVPDVLAGYVEKVARHAYRVTDEDVAALERAGYSEDAIFEITVSAAFGAARGRLERGLAALRSDRA